MEQRQTYNSSELESFIQTDHLFCIDTLLAYRVRNDRWNAGRLCTATTFFHSINKHRRRFPGIGNYRCDFETAEKRTLAYIHTYAKHTFSRSTDRLSIKPLPTSAGDPDSPPRCPSARTHVDISHLHQQGLCASKRPKPGCWDPN